MARPAGFFIKPGTTAMFDVAANKDLLRRFFTEVWSNGALEAALRI